MYKYETHLHTAPVSKCARFSVRKALEFYRSLHYDGVFITNHFIDGNLNIDSSLPYEKRINFYFSDYEEGVRLSKEIGIKVFCGVESSLLGTDFMIYGLDKDWFLSHPEIEQMTKKEVLPYYMEHRALVIQTHPFRQAGFIDHIRLFPDCVHGVETVNASRKDSENEMAKLYAGFYQLLEFAGTDNHGITGTYLAGMKSTSPIESVDDFIRKTKKGELKIFREPLNQRLQKTYLSEIDFT